MRRSAVLVLAAVALGLVTPPLADPAAATTVCRAPVSVEGPVVKDWRPAMAAARAAWERRVARTHGGRFADWWYSGDRTIECTWDDRGVMYRCRATAIPCA